MDSGKGEFSNEALFAGRYRIMRCVGRGGMGEVYLAQDALLDNQEVALKVIHEDLCKNEKYVRRFLREVCATRMITDPSVVRTFDAGVELGRLYFSMEYVRGVTLEEELEHGSFTLGELLGIFYRVCQGIAAIHEAGVIHRDLKPSNIILTTEGIPKISDFGLARAGDSGITKTSEIIGTLAYLAPELLEGAEVTTSVDIYALGVISYEMFTGKCPFEGSNNAHLLLAHAKHTPTHPSKLVPEIPTWLGDITMNMLQKTPEKRPENTTEIVKQIEMHTERLSGNLDPLHMPYQIQAPLPPESDPQLPQIDPFGSGASLARMMAISQQERSVKDTVSSNNESSLRKAVDTIKKNRSHVQTAIRALLLVIFVGLVWYIGFSDSYRQRRSSPGGVIGLVGWFRADSVVGRNGSGVAKLSDNSMEKSTATQPLRNHQPTYKKFGSSGFPVMSFDGKNDFLHADGIARSLRGSTGMTVIYVARNLNADKNHYVWSSHLDDQEQNLVHAGFSKGEKLRVRTIINPFQRGYHESYPLETSEFAIYVVTINERKVATFQNSKHLFTDTTSYDVQFPRAAYFSLGQEYDDQGPGDFFQGELAEMMIYNRALGKSERQRIEGLLASKYKIGLRE